MIQTGYVPLQDRAALSVAGADARPFLQGLITSDIERLAVDRSLYAALLTPQGKYLFDFLLFGCGDAIWLDVEARRAQDLLKRLMLYRLRARVTLEASDDHAVAAVIGPDSAKAVSLPDERGAARVVDDGVISIDPRLADLGARAILPRNEVDAVLGGMDLPRLPDDAYEAHRLGLGVPDGSRDIEVERAVLLECGFEELDGVDFSKGCFVGQEVTARTRYRGLVKKRLVPVVLDGADPGDETEIRLGDREAGRLRTHRNGRGIALVRLDRLDECLSDGVPLQIGSTRLTPTIPEWMSAPRSGGRQGSA